MACCACPGRRVARNPFRARASYTWSARSIHVQICESEGFGLSMRWHNVEEQYGVPHRSALSGLQGINVFAMGELSTMVAQGRGSQSPALPLTDTHSQGRTADEQANRIGQHPHASNSSITSRNSSNISSQQVQE